MRLAVLSLCLLSLGACRTSAPGRALGERIGFLGQDLRSMAGIEAGRDFGLSDAGTLAGREFEGSATPETGAVLRRYFIARNVEGLTDVDARELAGTVVLMPRVEKPAQAQVMWGPDNPFLPSVRLPHLRDSIGGLLERNRRWPSLDWEQPKPTMTR